VLIRTVIWDIPLNRALTDELTANDLPVGWDVEAANVAIDRLLAQRERM